MRFLLLVLVMVGSSVFANTPVTVALDWYINPDHAPLLIAKERGFFQQQGLDVRLIEPTSATEALQMVAAHQATFAIDYQPHVMMSISQGIPVKRISTLVAQPLNCIAMLSNNHLQSLADLKGKTIGYSGAKASLALLQTMLQHNGLALKDVHLINLNMDLTQALLSQQVDAVNGMMRNVEPIVIQAQGIQTTLFYPEKNGVPPYDALIMIAHTDVNPKTVMAFNQALQQGVQYLKRHPAESWRLARAAYTHNLSATKAQAQVNEQIWMNTVPYFASNIRAENKAAYNRFMQYLLTIGLLKSPLAFNRYSV